MLALSRFGIRAFEKLGILDWFNVYSRITVNNKKFSVPVLKRLGFHNLWLSEPWMTELLLRLKPLFNGHFVDVGVNTGQTLIKTQAIFDAVNYLGFEPNPVCAYYSEELVKLNKFRNCHIIPVGINAGAEILKLNFYYADNTDPSASIVEQFRPEAINHSKYVPVFDFDFIGKFLPEMHHSFLKIDVEGAELDVIKGLQPWLKQTRPIILMEVLPVYKKENEFRLTRQQMMESLLHGMDYKIARIQKETPVKLNELDEIGIHANIDDSDYIIFPAEVKDRIRSCFK